MRLYILRSIIFVVLASAIAYAMPASAAPMEPGLYVLHDDAYGVTENSVPHRKGGHPARGACLSQ